ncbi:MAG: hypothetical protein IPN09_10530 [Bacteroidetes bacterium]|jgi:hypothetical protein|nr:hypothetical protein [Bacteroidota bacterium]
MFKIFKYIALFFLGYKLLKSIFGNPSNNLNEEKKPNRIRKNENSEPNQEPIEKKPIEGEYIDFEEIKK